MPDNSLPLRLRDSRKAAGLTQVQLAEQSGVSVHSIEAYEQGRNQPTVTSIKALARALRTSIDDLVEGDA